MHTSITPVINHHHINLTSPFQMKGKSAIGAPSSWPGCDELADAPLSFIPLVDVMGEGSSLNVETVPSLSLLLASVGEGDELAAVSFPLLARVTRLELAGTFPFFPLTARVTRLELAGTFPFFPLAVVVVEADELAVCPAPFLARLGGVGPDSCAPASFVPVPSSSSSISIAGSR